MNWTCEQEAQSRVAAFALYQFFADLPLRQLLTEPYSSLVLRWQEGWCYWFISSLLTFESSRVFVLHIACFHKTGELLSTSRVLDTEDSRRAGFVDMLLNMDADTSHIEDSSAGVILVDTGDTEDNKSVHEKRETSMMSCMGKLSIQVINSITCFWNIFLNNVIKILVVDDYRPPSFREMVVTDGRHITYIWHLEQLHSPSSFPCTFWAVCIIKVAIICNFFPCHFLGWIIWNSVLSIDMHEISFDSLPHIYSLS